MLRTRRTDKIRTYCVRNLERKLKSFSNKYIGERKVLFANLEANTLRKQS